MIFHQLPASTHGSHASTIIDLCASIDQIFLKSESETAKILVLNQDQIKNGNEWWRMDEEHATHLLDFGSSGFLHEESTHSIKLMA